MNGNTRHYILATAGHVDHGKSALIERLTGTHPDRLPEEKARGITIDLGFASLDLPSPPSSGQTAGSEPSQYRVGIVDVPGHEDFVKNMVAGVGSIDVALLIVAADDGWMPQSEEHLQILSYAGVNRAVVALTKSDLLTSEDQQSAVLSKVADTLQNSPFSGSPIIPTSIVENRGIDELRSALTRVLRETVPPRDIGKPRLPVDRVFTLRGIGTVVTGTLTGGTLCRGQSVIIQPSMRKTRVRSVQSHNIEVDQSVPGTRTALNLPDIASHIETGSRGIARGNTITLPDFGAPSLTLDVLLGKSQRLIESKHPSARPLKDGALVRIHLGSGNVAARIALSGPDRIGPGEQRIAQLRCETPLFAFSGDHFIVRDWSEEWTLAGGVVLEPDAGRTAFRRGARQRSLQPCAASPNHPKPFILSRLSGEGAVRRSTLLVKSRFGRREIDAALSEIENSETAILSDDWIIEIERWRHLRTRAEQTIDTEHELRPQNPGPPITDLRRALSKELPHAELFEILTADLCRNGFVQSGTTIRRGTHKPALPPELQAAGATVRRLLTAKPAEPPSRKELAPDKTAQQALRFLLQTGEAVEISAEVVLNADAYGKAIAEIKQHLGEKGTATVSELRQVVGASRRIVIPLLERLDRQKITRREGDRRRLY